MLDSARIFWSMTRSQVISEQNQSIFALFLVQIFSNNYIQQKNKDKKTATEMTRLQFFVAVPGLEPRLREPESRVLPLHHTAKILLPHRDSNSVKQNQNLVCYHYTMGQSSFS